MHPIRPKLLNDIVEFERWTVESPCNGMDYSLINMHHVLFISDFGPWRKGDRVYCLIFDPFYGTLTQGNNWDELIKSCRVDIVPIDQ